MILKDMLLFLFTRSFFCSKLVPTFEQNTICKMKAQIVLNFSSKSSDLETGWKKELIVLFLHLNSLCCDWPFLSFFQN